MESIQLYNKKQDHLVPTNSKQDDDIEVIDDNHSHSSICTNCKEYVNNIENNLELRIKENEKLNEKINQLGVILNKKNELISKYKNTLYKYIEDVEVYDDEDTNNNQYLQFHNYNGFQFTLSSSSSSTTTTTTTSKSSSNLKRKSSDSDCEESSPTDDFKKLKRIEWTEEEDLLFYKVFECYGKNWKMIHTHFPDKLKSQVTSHGQYLIKTNRLPDKEKVKPQPPILNLNLNHIILQQQEQEKQLQEQEQQLQNSANSYIQINNEDYYN